MLHGAGSRKRLALAIGLLAIVASCSSSPSSTTGTNPAGPTVKTDPATFVGPVLASVETATFSLGQDGGITVPLPNGKTFWVFGDTPSYTYKDNKWNLTGFIQGSSAGIGTYTPGQVPTAPINMVAPGLPSTKTTPATQFLPPPDVFLPDGSGKVCNKENGGPTAGAVRWASGAALMADKTNIFVPFIDACVISETDYRAEGWGFAMFNWKTNKFTTPPIDVIPPKSSGEALSSSQYFSSPIIDGQKVTMFSYTCCALGSSMYATTLDTDLKTLKDPTAYRPAPILGLPATFMFAVSPATKALPFLTMYQLVDLKGAYRLLTATSPLGPWTEKATGTLPKCDSAPEGDTCNNSMYPHPEFSTAGSVTTSYWLPGFGPGVPTNPDPSHQIWHLVYAKLPI